MRVLVLFISFGGVVNPMVSRAFLKGSKGMWSSTTLDEKYFLTLRLNAFFAYFYGVCLVGFFMWRGVVASLRAVFSGLFSVIIVYNAFMGLINGF